MKLIKVGSYELKPLSPFAFDPTFHKPDHFTSGDNYWILGIKWQTWNWEESCYGLKFENKGSVEKPKVLLSIYSQSKPFKEQILSLIEEVKYRYNFNLDLTDFYNRFKSD